MNRYDVSDKYFTVKISMRISAICYVVYYNKVLPFQAIKWGWYFEYLRSLIQVRYPRAVVELFCEQGCLSESKEDWVKRHLPTKKRGVQSTITKLQNQRKLIPQNLFGDAYNEIDRKIKDKQDELECLEQGIYDYYIPDDYLNDIKKYLQK